MADKMRFITEHAESDVIIMGNSPSLKSVHTHPG